MAYLYLTENYKRKFDFPDMEYYHDKLRNSEDPTSFLEQFDQTDIWKMRVKQKDTYRLILQKVTITIENKDYDVFCAKDLVSRGSKEYKYWDKFARRRKEKNPIEGETLEKVKYWLQEELKKEKEALKKYPLLEKDPTLVVFTQPIISFHLAHSHIYESQEWLTSIKSKVAAIKNEHQNKKEAAEEYLEKFYEEICSFVRDLYEHSQSPNLSHDFDIIDQNEVALLARKNDLFVVYAQLSVFNKDKKNAQKVFFLLDIYFEEEKAMEFIRFIRLKYPYTHETEKKQLLRDCKRTYEDFVLYDSKLWRKIQENEKANLALSTEERNILQNPTFPMFINGQAGSGKSTVLYYLFAHFYGLQYENPHTTPNCLFFTYNEELLDRAQKNICAILQHNSKYLEETIEVDNLKNSFFTLRDFVVTYLLPKEEKHLFSEEKYMSFGKFKLYYLGKSSQNKYNCTLFGTEKHSPDLVWHIIRTYIKGYQLEEYFDLKDYKKLIDREKSVSDKEYEDVWEIAQKWYNKFYENDIFWDDQDLIRHLLLNVKKLPRSPVLFCDEVQDFTRIELDLIWRLSSFTQYNLAGHTNIPFAFAGDPNQTVHPTGFQWQNLKDAFERQFKGLKINDIDIEINQLHHNYRSKSAIIQFSNLIQRFRHDYLGIEELRPQISWQQKEGVSPCLFILEEDVTLKDLEDILQQSVILIPTSRSEEHYIRKNSHLKHLIPAPAPKAEKNDSQASKPPAAQQTSSNYSSEKTINEIKPDKPDFEVMSVASVKGLEFDKTVLYNFGDHVPASFQKCIKRKSLNDSEKMELIHFFSKLYVAVSRASEYLFIVDTHKGYEQFWTYFMDENTLVYQTSSHWKEKHTSLLSRGTKADLQNITENNPQKIAHTLRKSGKAKKDYSLLSRAQQYYQSIQLQAEAMDCGAWASWYREDWVEAGKLFAELNNISQASNAFWNAKTWMLLNKLLLQQSGQPSRLLIAQYMLNQRELYEILDNTYLNEYASPESETWRVVFEKIQQDFENLELDEKFFISYSDYAEYAQKIGKKGFDAFYDIAGSFYFNDKKYEKAIEAWDCNHNPNEEASYTVKRPNYQPINYFKAKIATTKNINKKAFWQHQLDDHEALIDIYKNSNNKISQKFKTASYNYIFDAFIKQKMFEDALQFPHIPLKNKTKKLLTNIENLGKQAKTEERRHKLFELLLKKRNQGAKVLVSHIEAFKPCFEEKHVIRKILKNESWKSILDAHQKSFKKARIFKKMTRDFLVYLKTQNWTDDTAQNEALAEKLAYVVPLIPTLNEIDYKLKQLEKIFRLSIRHSLGIDLIHKEMAFFEPLFADKKILKYILERNNWSDLLKEFESKLQEGLSTQYVEVFVAYVCQHLSRSQNQHLPHTIGLVETLETSNQLTQYAKLINAASISDSMGDSVLPSVVEILKRHLMNVTIKSEN